MRRGSNQLRLADFNQALVLDLVRRTPGASRADIRRASGLSPQTITNISRRLLDEELIAEGPPSNIERGRPSIPLVVNADGAYSVGVHIEPAVLTVVLLDLSGEVRHKMHLSTPEATNPGRATGVIADAVDVIIAEAGIERERVMGLGIAAPGPLDLDSGVILDPPQLPQWRNVRLRADLHEATGLPVLLEKDVTASATAEVRSSTQAASDFIFLHLGFGVGASVVLDNQVLRGTTNNFGEIGEMIVDPNAEWFEWSGRRGTLGAACVPEALVVQAANAGLVPLPNLHDQVAIDEACAQLCALAAADHMGAVRLLERSAERVAVALGSLVNLLDISHIVLGGPLWGRLSSTFLPLLPALVRKELIVARDLTISGSSIGEHIAAQGAAELVMDHFLAPHPSTLMVF